MAGPLEATVVLGKCSKNRNCFGMRVEKRGGAWVRTWAFPIEENVAKNEGFNANKVNVSGTDSGYPGCPHCKDGGFALCSCGKIGCLGDKIKKESSNKEKNALSYTCPWCGQTGEIQIKESIDVSGGGY
ncbi:MAG: hypothetical protein FWB95_00955 [Treponema sp.]|nr:hypothetical protein [Treponema sp.]